MKMTIVPLPVYAAAALALAYALSGCAVVPQCAPVQASLVPHQGSVYAVFDEENIAKLWRRQKDLQDGRCRLSEDGAT